MKRIIVTIVLSVMGLAVLTGCSYSSGSSWSNSDTPDDYCCYDSDYEIPAQVVDFYEISFHSIGRDPWFPRIYNGHREDIEDVYDYCEEHREMLENVTIVDVTEDTCAIVIGDRSDVHTYATGVPLSQLSFDAEQLQSVDWETNYCHIAVYRGSREISHYLNGRLAAVVTDNGDLGCEGR